MKRRPLAFRQDESIMQQDVMPTGTPPGPFGPRHHAHHGMGLGPMFRRTLGVFAPTEPPTGPEVGAPTSIVNIENGKLVRGELKAITEKHILLAIDGDVEKFRRSEWEFALQPRLELPVPLAGIPSLNMGIYESFGLRKVAAVLDEMKVVLTQDPKNGETYARAKTPTVDELSALVGPCRNNNGVPKGSVWEPKMTTIMRWLDSKYDETKDSIYDREAPGYLANFLRALSAGDVKVKEGV